ncbi:hypothetical protein ON064_11270 [Planococcus sp. A6]|uniref:hypothetical protein n=1 Tax=Planococcus sp. A6 TaxID=2992760 RepID=UPI00237B2F54|nr:hypothetical protein [Planococcus sp. A6]MDE0583614.1 hypothetical protein [Planococcus sp. A6]
MKEWKVANPAGAVTEQCDGATWTEDPGPSKAREAAEAMPAESVRLERIHNAASPFITSYLHNK